VSEKIAAPRHGGENRGKVVVGESHRLHGGERLFKSLSLTHYFIFFCQRRFL
jgi:hypothetical protein